MVMLLSVLSAAGLMSCSDESDELLPAGTTSGEPAQLGERSVLVYMLSDNSLGDDGYDHMNLYDMVVAASKFPEGSRLIVYHDEAYANTPMLKEVTDRGLRIIKEYDDGPHAGVSVTAERMRRVIADFKAEAPAKRYGLIFWSHATGWLVVGNGSLSDASTQWVGEDRRHYMDVATLAGVLEDQGFDYIYFDCCHMASVEALYELRRCADRFVGSCAELPAAGMPYDKTLHYLMPYDANLEGAARTVYNNYNTMSGRDRSLTISVIESERLEALASATRNLFSLQPVLPADYEGQKYERSKYGNEPCYLYDFEHYITALYNNNPSSEMRQAYAAWLLALDDCVSYSAATPWMFSSLKIDTHCGLSTYILRSESDASVYGYRRLQWYSDVASQLNL